MWYVRFIFVVRITKARGKKLIDLAIHEIIKNRMIKIQSTNRITSNRKFHCPNREKDEKKQTIGYSVGIRSGSDVAGLPGARVDSRVEADFARRCTSDVTIKRTTSDERIRAAHEERGGELWLDFKASN